MRSYFFVQYVTFFNATRCFVKIQNFYGCFHLHSFKSIKVVALQYVWNHYYNYSFITKNPKKILRLGIYDMDMRFDLKLALVAKIYGVGLN